jgi:hypothetical protein
MERIVGFHLHEGRSFVNIFGQRCWLGGHRGFRCEVRNRRMQFGCSLP